MVAPSTPHATPGLVTGLAADASPGESLAPWTSIRIGGPAELLVRPRNPGALVSVLGRARANGVPVHVLGGGANTLVGDLGIPGVTLKLPPDLFPEEVHPLQSGGGLVTLGAGVAIVRLTNLMRARGWVGAEFLAGIPFVACLLAGAYYSRWFFAGALLVFALGFALQRLRFRRCTCETCGSKLHREMSDGAPIEFFCEPCHTIWTTSVIQDGAA